MTLILNLLLFVPLLFLCIFFWFFIFKPLQKINSYKQKGTPVHFFPIIGLFHYWASSFKKMGDAMGESKNSSKQHPGSKFLLTNIKGRSILILRDPQYIKEFLLKPNLYHKSKITESLKLMMRNGLIFSEDDVWKRHRKIISNSFHYDFLKRNIHVVQSTTKEFLDNISTTESYKNYPVISKIQEITGEIVGRIFFGENLNNYRFEGEPLTLALAEIIDELSLVDMTPLIAFLGIKALKLPIPRYKRITQKVRDFRSLCFKIISDKKMNKQESTDLLTSLLETQNFEDPENVFSDEDIVDQFITFFVGGMDTTGHLVGMALYNLTQYPEYLGELKQERDQIYNKEPILTAETLQKMDILHSFLKETLRFYTPAPTFFVREAITDHQLMDLDVKKGDYLAPEFLAPAFDEKNFEEPYKFNPARWGNLTNKTDPYAFLPFSAGPRNCIGQHLAMIEAKIILSEFLERFHFKLKEGYKLKMSVRFLYEPKDEPLLDLYSIQS